MKERRWYSFEPRLMPRAAANMGKAVLDLSLDLPFWVLSGAVQLPVLVKLSESFAPEVAASALVPGMVLSIISVTQGRRFMERYLNIPTRLSYSR